MNCYRVSWRQIGDAPNSRRSADLDQAQAAQHFATLLAALPGVEAASVRVEANCQRGKF